MSVREGRGTSRTPTTPRQEIWLYRGGTADRSTRLHSHVPLTLTLTPRLCWRSTKFKLCEVGTVVQVSLISPSLGSVLRRQELAPTRERGGTCLAWLPWRRRACPSATLDKQSVFSCGPTITNPTVIGKSPVLRGALSVQHFGREFRRLGEVDEVGRHRLLRRQAFEIREHQPHALDADAAGEVRRRRIHVTLFCLHLDEPIDRVGYPARRDFRRQTAEARAAMFGAATDHHEVLRHGFRAEPPHASLKSDRRNVMLTASIRAPA